MEIKELYKIISILKEEYSKEPYLPKKVECIGKLGNIALNHTDSKSFLLYCVCELQNIACLSTNAVIKSECIKTLGQIIKKIKCNSEDDKIILLCCAESLEKILRSLERKIGFLKILYDGVNGNREFSEVVKSDSEKFKLINSFISEYESLMAALPSSTTVLAGATTREHRRDKLRRCERLTQKKSKKMSPLRQEITTQFEPVNAAPSPQSAVLVATSTTTTTTVVTKTPEVSLGGVKPRLERRSRVSDMTKVATPTQVDTEPSTLGTHVAALPANKSKEEVATIRQ